MNDYRTIQGDLASFMATHKNVSISTPVKAHEDPVGWKTRERFGVTMRYWPSLSEIYHLEGSMLAAHGIPRMYMKYYIDEIEPKDHYQAQVMNYMNIIYSVRKSPLPCLTVMGGNGCGKTLLGCALVNTVSRLSGCYDRNTGKADNWDAYFVNEADLFSRIEGYSRSGVDYFRLYSEECDLLVIDEFGMTQWTPTDTRRINQLLNKRFGNGLQTVVLTNKTVDEFFGLLSDQLRSRFRTGKSIQMGSPDYREKFIEDDDQDDPF